MSNANNGKGATAIVEKKPEQSGVIRRKKAETLVNNVEQNLQTSDTVNVSKKTFAQKEESIAYEIELARLRGIESARKKGRDRALVQFKREQLEKEGERKQHFESVELPQLLDSCEYLPYEAMKSVVTNVAAIAGVELEWKELQGGEFECGVRKA